MPVALLPKSSIVDLLDRQIIHCLQLDPRAPFNRIALALAVSEQTVSRRYRRLRAEGVLRVIALVDPRRIGQTLWTVRLTCRPDATLRLAEALARRDDVGWVAMTAGGSEIICLVRSLSRQQRDELLLSKLPNTSQVLSMSAYASLHQYRGASSADWVGDPDLLDAEQLRRLAVEPRAVGAADAVAIETTDQPLLEELAIDGRASYGQLARVTGWTEGRVVRRLDALIAGGTVYLDVDVATAALGFTTTAYLMMTVSPAHLAAAGERVASHAEVPYVAAVTGAVNLVASVVCRDADHLYDYLTTKVGQIEGIQQVEVMPILLQLKQAGALIEGNRLADPSVRAKVRRPDRASLSRPGR